MGKDMGGPKSDFGGGGSSEILLPSSLAKLELCMSTSEVLLYSTLVPDDGCSSSSRRGFFSSPRRLILTLSSIRNYRYLAGHSGTAWPTHLDNPPLALLFLRGPIVLPSRSMMRVANTIESSSEFPIIPQWKREQCRALACLTVH